MIDGGLQAAPNGLRYFDEFLHRAEQVRPQGVDIDRLRARYEGQAGLDIDTLTADADTLGRVLEVLDEQLRDQVATVHSLDASWSGEGADAAQRFLRQHLERAQQDHAAMTAAHEALVEAERALKSVIQEKNDVVAGFPDLIDGKGPADIDRILRGAAPESTDAGSTVLGEIVDIFTDLAPMIPAGEQLSSLARSVVHDPMIERCTQWLDQVFVPHVEEYLRNFDELCTATDVAVRDIYDQLTGALGAVDDSPYPAPGESGGSPGASAQPRTAQSEPMQRQSTDSLGGLLGELTQQVVGAATDVVGGVIDHLMAAPDHVDDGDPGSAEPDDSQPNSAAPSDAPEQTDDQEADFDVHGRHLHFEKQPDGDLTVEV